MSTPYTQSRSPPPLIHPQPTHISQPPPELPSTPDISTHTHSPYSPQTTTNRLSIDQARASFDAARLSSEGYTRYSSPPVQAPGQAQAYASGSAFGPGGAGTGGGYEPQSFGSFGVSSGSQGQGYPSFGLNPTSAGLHASSSSSSNPNGGIYNPASHGAPTQPGQGFQSMMGGGVGGGFNQWGMGGMGMGMGMNDATAQMGVQFGKSAVAAGQDYVEKNFTRYLPLPLLKTSFSVTNSYVLRKLRLILFPWRHKSWSRSVYHRGGGGGQDGMGGNMNMSGGVGHGGREREREGWMAPRDDINAPDLYIPTMALVTYVLLAAFASGLQSRFHPEVLGYSLSKAIGVVMLEFLCIKLGCYLLDVRGSGASGVELIGYGGYKFVGVIVTILASFAKLGNLFYFGILLYVVGADFFFILRSLKYVLLPDPSVSPTATEPVVATITHAQRRRRIQFLFVTAVAQSVFMAFLVRV